MYGVCFKLGFPRPPRMCIFTWTFLGDFNLETFSLQRVSPYYEITVQSRWSFLVACGTCTHLVLSWLCVVKKPAYLLGLTMPGYPNAPPFYNGEVRLEQGSCGSLVGGKAKVGSGPCHRRTKCISFPLKWTHNNSSRCLWQFSVRVL